MTILISLIQSFLLFGVWNFEVLFLAKLPIVLKKANISKTVVDISRTRVIPTDMDFPAKGIGYDTH